MSAFFQTAEQIAALERVAASWLGTPFKAHLAERGIGVDCVHLCAAIYERLEVIDSFAPPPYAITGGNHLSDSQVEAFLGGLADRFERLGDPQTQLAGRKLMPGDLLCFHVGRVTHHCAILLGRYRFIHAMNRLGVTEATLHDSTFARRLTAAYRPLAYNLQPAIH